MNKLPGRAAILAVTAPLILLGLGLAIERHPTVREAQEVVQSSELPGSAFGSRKLLRSLNRHGVLHPDFRRAILPQRQAGELTGGQRYLYATRPLAFEEMPSSLAVPKGWRTRDFPVLSLVLAPEEYSKLLANANRRGRRWERFAYVSYFESGEVRFASGAGLRVHGGMSRITSPRKSFRLYFRETLGAERIPPGIIFDEGAPALKRLVLHNDVRFDDFGDSWQFIRPLGFDIARKVGATVPETKPVWLLVNGKPLGVYVLTEYLDENYFRTRLGHEQFVLFRERKNPWDERFEFGAEEPFREFGGWLGSLGRKLSPEEASRWIDLEGLSRWFVAVLFCGTTDSLQGPAYLDLQEGEPRWRWVTWDLDHSFKVEWADKPGEDPWEIDVLPSIVFFSGRESRPEPSAPRSTLLRTLLRHRGYRRYLAHLFDEVMNHELTAEFLHERYEHYVGLATELGIENSTFDREVGVFLEKRPAALRRQLEYYLRIEESHRVEVSTADGCRVEVDGRLKDGDWVGRYFKGNQVTVSVESGCRDVFSGWSVAGAVVEDTTSPVLHLDVTGDLSIQPVFAQS